MLLTWQLILLKILMHKKIIPKKKLGQNFLIDPIIIGKIFDSLCIEEKDNILEIGPGEGALSFQLNQMSKEYIGIEKDGELVKYLEGKNKEIKIIHQDILKTNLSEFFDSKYRVIGNLPYNISTLIVEKIIEYRSKFIDIHLMLQKEFADRMLARPKQKSYGRLSVYTQLFFDIHNLFDINKESFIPKPKITSSFIKLIPKDNTLIMNEDIKEFTDFVKIIFNNRRKKIINNLNIPPHTDLINVNKRAEELEISEMLELYYNIKKHG